jgi:hypothetical protein
VGTRKRDAGRMKLEWVLLAEGIGQDAKGAATLIGLNQNVLMAPLPATTKRVVVAHIVFDDDELNEPNGAELQFFVRVEGPSGDVLNAISGRGEVAGRQWPDLPAVLDVPAELVVTADEYGPHEMIVEVVGPKRNRARGSVTLYVKPPPPYPATGQASPPRAAKAQPRKATAAKSRR